MWIRSQGKTKILKVEIIEYCTESKKITRELKNKKGKPIYFAGRPAEEIIEEKTHYYIFVNGIKCAEYSSEEKALKVLDLIEKHIDRLSMSLVAFQIPQDDEVQ